MITELTTLLFYLILTCPSFSSSQPNFETIPFGSELFESTGCFTMNDTKVFVYFSGYNASSDLKHVAKF
jgi:hypothetical protein